jgi:HPt (histidine-containing phosphotransfer) domain-containing protein/HAMP domain-containing protein
MSLRAKLVRTMIAMLLVTASGTVAVVAAMNVVSSRATLLRIEARLRQAAVDKGSGLVSGQALALRDLVADNAFGDVARLVERTVEQDREISYGLFLDEEMKAWGYAARYGGAVHHEAEHWRALGIDAASLSAPGIKSQTRVVDGGQMVFEFAVPVVDDHGIFLGSLRYALSDEALQKALGEARVRSRHALATTVFLLLLLGGCTIVVGVLLSRRAAARIARPVIDLTGAANLLAAGRRDIRVAISSGDELESLGNAFNHMATELQDSYHRLEEMNRNLEAIVDQRTRALATRNHDMRLVLDNVKQGFLTVSMEGVLAQERSAVVDEWFGPFAADTRFVDYLARVDPSFADAFAPAYDQLRDDYLPRELCLEQMPSRFQGGARSFRCNYVPLTEGAKMHGLLIVVEDITLELVQERGEAERQEMLALFEALTTDRLGLLTFFDEASELVRGLATGDAAAQKRLLHTLKGNSAMAGLEVLAALCHRLEDQLLDGPGPATAEQLQSLQLRWTELAGALERFLGDRGRDVVELSACAIERLAHEIRLGASLPCVLQRLADWKLEPAARPLGRLASYARMLSKRLGKGDLEIEVEGRDVRLSPDEWSGLWAQLVHVVRNAVDHGLEAPAARQAAGKPARARLRLGTSTIGGYLVVEIEDDGAGIDWDAVRDTARRLGLPHGSPAQLEEALFASGLTTKAAVTDVSGRGIGLGSVRAYVEGRRGTLAVESRAGRGTCLRVTLPLTAMEFAALPEGAARVQA